MTAAGLKLLGGLLFLMIGFGFLIFGPSTIRKYNIKKALSKPFPLEWSNILEQHFPLYTKIAPSTRQALEQKIHIFIRTKEFIGYKRSKVSEEVKLTIAAQACMLILNKEQGHFPNIKRVYVYPREIRCKDTGQPMAGYLETKGGRTATASETLSPEVRAVVLAWDIVRRDIDKNGESNIIVALFSQALDMENPMLAATPEFSNGTFYPQWKKVMDAHFPLDKIHSKSIKINGVTIDSREKILPTISECFFQSPEKLYQYSSELFELLTVYYAVDPREWA